ncbi:MAG: T9SS type A sorting domain-containing protein [Bacteroidetes bacterium]|nr:T9SS type A sorting domain-containing protein [Bacteroidota bacterium]
MIKILQISSLLLLFGSSWFVYDQYLREEIPVKKNRKGLVAFDWWYDQRALPGNIIKPDGLGKAYVHAKRALRLFHKPANEKPWQSLGPNNIGGRVLSLAIDPDSSNVVWAGSASGGLWRSSTGGTGADAWEYVNTVFNVLSVSTIAINNADADEMYIGTGEISGYELGLVGTPGARTTYGLGIIKSTDRGVTWISTGLTSQFSQNHSIQKIIINPKNPKTVFAATSEGTYRSFNSGATFQKVSATLMAMDVAMNHIDTSIVYIACGQRNTSPNSGLFKSTDGGSSFIKMSGGLPESNIGRTSLAIAPSNPNTVFASIANAVTHGTLGLYRTTNSGISWELMSTTNYMSGQGWYNNVAAVHPINSSIVFTAGLDAYKSISGGTALTQKSYWSKTLDGVIPPGGIEGTDNSYAHADHHAIVFDPKNPNRMFFGNDGGIFESTDGGTTFIGRNGGFVTTQFYNGFANAVTDSMIALGGLQDNGTVKFQGGMSWNKVFRGDGGWCAVDPINLSILYEEYVNLSISKSINGGISWFNIFSPASTDTANFIAPFVLAPSNSQILYAGAEKVHKSTNGGTSWFATNNNAALNSTSISCLAVSFTSPDTLIAATGRRQNPLFEIFYSTNGGAVWNKSTSPTPNRYPTDIAFDPSDSRIAYATFSGYGSPHVYRSTDAGATWTNISSNLPDLPMQSVCIDPEFSSDIYVGTDLGVYRSINGGENWEPWFDGMPLAMILDVSVSIKDRHLRAATFGNGVFQRKLRMTLSQNAQLVDASIPSELTLSQNYPNPFNPTTTMIFTLAPNHSPYTGGKGRTAAGERVTLQIFDISGKMVSTLLDEHKTPGTYTVQWNASPFASGVYFVTLQSGGHVQSRKLLFLK